MNSPLYCKTDFNTIPLVYASLLVRGNLLTIHVAQLGCPIQKINI